MEYMTGELNDGTPPYSAFKENEGKIISIKGAIHNIRDMSDFAFIGMTLHPYDHGTP